MKTKERLGIIGDSIFAQVHTGCRAAPSRALSHYADEDSGGRTGSSPCIEQSGELVGAAATKLRRSRAMSQILTAVRLDSAQRQVDVVWSEMSSQDTMDFKKALRMLRRLEALHAALSLPGRLMRVLSPVVLSIGFADGLLAAERLS